MLYDRDYMRGSDGAYWRSPVVLLLIAMVALFLLECVLRVYAGQSLSEYFGLGYQAVRRHEYWRLLTYQFLHDAPWPWHILFNGLALWFFGRSVLEAVGPGRFWKIFLISGFLGGLLEIACQAWHPRYGSSLTVGASASVLGLAGAFCLMFPTRETVFFFYVIPIRLRSMTMFWILFGFSVFGTVFPHGRIAHAAHLGGLLTGAAFAWWMMHLDCLAWLRSIKPQLLRSPKPRPLPVGKVAGQSARGGPAQPEADSPDEFIRREVDPILDKISAHGIQSLTERERRILEKARQRMRER